ncbi:MAG: ferritin family protein [Eubacteriales bacterium]|nr:ferritin family protein [Eubacteriales bacterium]
MEERNGLTITTRDRLLRAWQNTTELVRDFETYSKETDDNEETAALFARYAEDEGYHAAKLLELLREQDGNEPNGKDMKKKKK